MITEAIGQAAQAVTLIFLAPMLLFGLAVLVMSPILIFKKR